MRHLRRALPLLASWVLLTPACSSIRPAYITAKSVKNYTDGAYDVYSSELALKEKACDPEVNKAIKFAEDYDKCLGKGFTADDLKKIKIAVASYKIAAEAMTAALLGTQDELSKYQAWATALEAVYTLLQVLPGGQEHAEALDKILGGK